MASLSFPALPLALASLIVEFAVSGFTQDLLPTGRSLPAIRLKDLSLVSKNWHHLIRQLTAQFQLETMEIYVKKGSRSELLDIRRDVLLRGRRVKDLRLTIGFPGKDDGGASSFTIKFFETENAQIDWDSLFVHLNYLKRLDLKMVPLESRHLSTIIRAAAKHCERLEALVLPRKANLEWTIQGTMIEKVLSALYAGMESWYSKGGRGGLRQLTVPTRNDAMRFRSSTKFLENVSRFCPNVEYLNRCEEVFQQQQARCEDRWVTSIETWEKFNETCTELRDFNWAAVPFADPYFRVFGEYPKLKLKHLELSANLLWNWKEYFKVCGDSTAADIETGKSGYGQRVRDIGDVFKGCPGLTSVTIGIDVEGLAEDDIEHLDIAVFGDAFWESAAIHCAAIESVRIKDCSKRKATRVETIKSFTDAALLRLADLRYLNLFESKVALMCTGNGIFECLRRIAKSNLTNGNWCTLSLRVGGQQLGDFGPPSFYAEVVALLKRLSETSEEDLWTPDNSKGFEVIVINPYRSTVSKTWSNRYQRNELQPLLESVKTTHPGLNINLRVNGHTEDGFLRIDRMSLSWHRRDADRVMFTEKGDGNLVNDSSVDMVESLNEVLQQFAHTTGRQFSGPMVAGEHFLHFVLTGSVEDSNNNDEDSGGEEESSDDSTSDGSSSSTESSSDQSSNGDSSGQSSDESSSGDSSGQSSDESSNNDSEEEPNSDIEEDNYE